MLLDLHVLYTYLLVQVLHVALDGFLVVVGVAAKETNVLELKKRNKEFHLPWKDDFVCEDEVLDHVVVHVDEVLDVEHVRSVCGEVGWVDPLIELLLMWVKQFKHFCLNDSALKLNLLVGLRLLL